MSTEKNEKKAVLWTGPIKANAFWLLLHEHPAVMRGKSEALGLDQLLLYEIKDHK